MIHTPMDVLHQFPVRKSRKQKQQFRNAVIEYVQKQGYCVTKEKGSWGCRNLVIGNPETASYLVTAHYDTCARLPFSNFLMPENAVLFVLRQLALWFGIILSAALIGVAAGLLHGEGFRSPISVIAALSIVILMRIGPANQNNSNDNTSGVVTLLEILRSLPENQRSKVCFVLFDLEEAGLIGSACYRKAHKAATDRQLVLNLDCVGDGDYIRMYPTKKLLKDRKKLTSLYKACGYFGKKSVEVHEKGFGRYPSDHKRFPYAVGIVALNRHKAGLYLGKIHTPKDTVLDETNVNILRAALISYISCGVAQ